MEVTPFLSLLVFLMFFKHICSMKRLLTVLTLTLATLQAYALPDTPYDSGTLITYHTALTRSQRDIVDMIYASLSEHIYDITFPSPVAARDLDAAVENILTDYPELFYVGDEYIYQWRGDRDDRITAVSFTPAMDRENAEHYYALMAGDINAAIASLGQAGSLEYETAFHDALIEMVSYSVEDDSDYTPYGAILYGKAACEGYAEAFTLMMRLTGIPCSVVGGTGYSDGEQEPHAWNIVCIDGVYTLVDVTWDDLDIPGCPSYIYFNITDRMMARDHDNDPLYDRHPAASSLDFNPHRLLGLEAGKHTDLEDLAWEMISLVLEGEPVSVRFNDRSTFRRFEKNFDGYMQSYADHFERDVNLSRMPDPVQLACTLLP